jgi:signal transduction histidine kinase
VVRALGVVLLSAVVCLTASSVVWLRASARVSALSDGATGAALLAELQQTQQPFAEIDLATRYAGRLELLDPRLALPTWHKHVRDEAARVHTITKQCPPVSGSAPVNDAALAKALAWHERTCPSGAPPADELVDRPPFMHPSGRSYALLALGLAHTGAWTRAHLRSFHVIELAALEPAALDADDRALAALTAHAWEALGRGDHLVLDKGSLLIAEQGALGPAKLRFYPRDQWEAFSRESSLALVPRAASALCAQPASPELCWEPRTSAERHRPVFLAWTTSSAAIVVFASLALGFAYVAERRRAHSDRIHVLRTLTHELRTPATSVRLDIEPLRAAYDELPAGCQEPLLRVSDGIERLHRVLHRSARYMALFEDHAPGTSLVKVREVPSAKTMFEEFSEEWPEGVTLTAPPQISERTISTDPEWLGVAVRNLVENATRHGKPPVAVTWALEGTRLVVRVSDGGSTPKLTLRRAIAPHRRDAQSSGLGLGLAIADRVASLLGGRLLHEPSPTVFELRVPAFEHGSHEGRRVS